MPNNSLQACYYLYKLGLSTEIQVLALHITFISFFIHFIIHFYFIYVWVLGLDY